MIKDPQDILTKMYDSLYRSFGPQHWWPGETSFEVIIGAILTQNTNWNNVEKAILNLRRKKLLTPLSLRRVPEDQLALLIKPAGYFNVKADRLKCFIEFLFVAYEGDLKRMGQEKWPVLRKKILSVKGIGPETADSILLYAFNKPIFVVDAYT
ncbi:MAG: endonuclease III domain-containing protein, partial [Alphaproteobacteria bacterium]|nr:endonuclease III domain-containing protein [Alphaproteobacteria bacterium]